MSLDLAALAPGLEQRDTGLWFARRRVVVSYPEQGNAACLAVEDGSFWFRHRNRCIVSVVSSFGCKGTMLDIGGGNGYVAKGLAAAGIECVVVEPGIDGALAAHRRGIAQVICATLEDADLPVGCAAAAGMFDVLEHIEDEQSALRHVHRLLRPDGHVFVTVPAYPLLFSNDDKAAGHFRRYTRASLARSLSGAGFRVVFSSYIFSPLPPLVFLLRTLPSRLGWRQGVDAERDAAEHAPQGLAARLVDRLLDAEYRRLALCRPIPFGGSCLAVAVKV